MSERYLDLHDKVRVIDFLADNLAYASPKMREDAETWIRQYEDGEKVATDKLAEAARKFAWNIWPAKYAVDRFFSTDGIDQEWEKVLSSVRPSTGHLLKRFRKGTGSKSLDETLTHVEADVAFHEGERLEIGEIRKHLRQTEWTDKRDMLKQLVDDGDHLVHAFKERLDALRAIGTEVPRTLQDEIFSKIERFEDQILFDGKTVPLEILDEEIKYYTEQKEISPLEG